MKNYKKSFFLLFLVCIGVMYISCKHQPYILPQNLRTGDSAICFERDILPIFQSNCTKSGCHNPGSHKGGYTLDNYDNIVKKGIVPGNPAASVIWQAVSMNIFNVTPMPEEAPSLSSYDLDLIKRWIATGAIDSGACSTSVCDTNSFTYNGTIAPLMQTYCTGCHNSPSAPGGSLADYNSVKNAAVNGNMIGDISHSPGYNAMPQGGNMLINCQITQIKKWVAAGAPQN